MIAIRLICPLRFDHFEMPGGTLVMVPPDVARRAVMQGIAVMAEPERAVVEPKETRVNRPRRRAMQ
jgi:hypothetical protein